MGSWFLFYDLKYLQEKEYIYLFPPGSTIPYCFILWWNFEFAPSIIKNEILIKSKNQTEHPSPVIIWNKYLFCPKDIDYKKMKELYFSIFHTCFIAAQVFLELMTLLLAERGATNMYLIKPSRRLTLQKMIALLYQVY